MYVRIIAMMTLEVDLISIGVEHVLLFTIYTRLYQTGSITTGTPTTIPSQQS